MGGAENRERNVGGRRGLAAWMVWSVGSAGQRRVRAVARSATGLRWYRVVYWLAYRLGLTVWRRPSPPADLVALVEGPSPLTRGTCFGSGLRHRHRHHLPGHPWLGGHRRRHGAQSVGHRAPRRRRGGRRPALGPRRRDPPAAISASVTATPCWWTSAAFTPCPTTSGPPTSPASRRLPRRERRCCCTAFGDRPRPRPCTPG